MARRRLPGWVVPGRTLGRMPSRGPAGDDVTHLLTRSSLGALIALEYGEVTHGIPVMLTSSFSTTLRQRRTALVRRQCAEICRWSFRLVELRPGAVDRARSLKPSIALVAESGIAMRGEVVLERLLC